MDVSQLFPYLPAGATVVVLSYVAVRVIRQWMAVSEEALEVQSAIIEELREEANRLVETYRDPAIGDADDEEVLYD